VLLNEPFSALDPITRRDVQVRTLQGGSKTLVAVTHDVREALLRAPNQAGEDRKMVSWGRLPICNQKDPEARVFCRLCLRRRYPGAPYKPHPSSVTQSSRSHPAHFWHLFRWWFPPASPFSSGVPLGIHSRNQSLSKPILGVLIMQTVPGLALFGFWSAQSLSLSVK
jgi:hypothetical protein